MRTTPVEQFRNIGIAAHIDAGKTTTTERILLFTGRIRKAGEVHEGTTVTDWMEEEQRRGITITSAGVTTSWRGLTLNIIDTPGHVDFTAEVERSLNALDSVIALFCAVGGVEAQAEAVWRQAEKRGIPRLAFVNKMDRVGADFKRTLRELREKLKATPLPLQLPIGEGEDFRGVADLVAMKALYFTEDAGLVTDKIPPGLLAEAEALRESMVEKLSEHSDELLGEYLAGAVGEQTIRKAVRAATVKGFVTPVLFGSALKNAGIEPLLDAVACYMPNPADRIPVEAMNRVGEKIIVSPDPQGPLVAQVFKLATDREYGRLAQVRIHSGTVSAGDKVQNQALGTEVSVEGIYRVFANEVLELESAGAGDIVALAGVDANTGDTLTTPGFSVRLEQTEFAEPVATVALEPKSEAEREGLTRAVAELASLDPTIHHAEDDFGRIILKGMGELHLEVFLARLGKEYKVFPSVGQLGVELKTTLAGAAVEEAAAGTKGLEVFVRVSVEPSQDESQAFVLECPPGFEVYESALAAGAGEALHKGGWRGEFTGVKVRLLELKKSTSHALQERDVKVAVADAVSKALARASTTTLEPFMELEISVPEENFGTVLSDLKARGARVTGLEQTASERLVKALAPLSQLFGYDDDIRRKTRGRAAFSMKFSGYKQIRT